MPRVGIALGSNLGDRLAHLQAAIISLRGIAVAGGKFLEATIYQTEPLLCPPGSPLFFNTAVEIAYEGDPFGLLETTRLLEQQLGRIAKTERNAPRVIDIDLLYFGDVQIDSEALILPHPRIGERRFVLQPLADIRPDLILPGAIQTVAETLETLVSEEPPLIPIITG